MSTQKTVPNPRGGSAPPIVLLALVIVGVMVTGGFHLVQREARIELVSHRATAALYVAEAGAIEVLDDWSVRVYGTLEPWERTTVTGSAPGGVYSVDVLRTSPWNYLLESTGTVTGSGAVPGGATRRVGMAVRIRTPLADLPAALATRGELRIGASSFIGGIDRVPGGWGGVCDSVAVAEVPAILIDDHAEIVASGRLRAHGRPTVREGPAITVESLLPSGDPGWGDLTGLASSSHTFSTQTLDDIGPVERVDGTCDRSAGTNWGAPHDARSPCFDFFPLIHSTGDLEIAGGSGQGILLVEGDLEVRGGFEFYGPVIVRGTLLVQGAGAHFNGGVIVANVNGGASALTGQASVNYSSCALTRSMLHNPSLTRAALLAERAWIDLTNLAH